MLFGDDPTPTSLLITAISALVTAIVSIASGAAIVAWRIGKWFKRDVAEPVIKSHLELIETLKKELPAQTIQLNKQTAALNDISSQFRAHHELAEHISETTVQLAEKVGKMEPKP